MTLKALKPKDMDGEPVTLGEHIKRRRRELGLTQKEAAALLRVSEFTIINWEKGKTESPITSIPAILAFLGYDPFPEPKTLSERMLAKRRVMGWTIAEAARQLGVDEETWGGWEWSGNVPWRRCLERLSKFLEY